MSEVVERPRSAHRLDEAGAFASSQAPGRLTILHFNDVYNIEGFAKEPVGGAARFRTALQQHGAAAVVGAAPGDSLVLFSGDAFAPSVMSTMLKGAQMPPVLEALGIDVAMFGNHDFDFGLETCAQLAGQTSFPWLLSNARLKADPDPEAQLGGGKKFVVVERNGRKIGVMGLIESEWLATLATLDVEEVEYTDFVAAARALSAELRAPPHSVDCVVALTHMRQPNDAKLALEAGDVIDIILGGHDHHYEVFSDAVTGCYVCKSGTDFKDMTRIELDFADDAAAQAALASGKVVRTTVASTEHVIVDSKFAEDPAIKLIVDDKAAAVITSLAEPIGATAVGKNTAFGETPRLDARFQAIRTAETNAGNLVCDVIRDACNCDVALLNSGTLRSDTIHETGALTKRDLVNLLPMADDMCVIVLTVPQLLAALENGVSQWPRLEGRFPQVSGVRFEFDADKPAGARVRAATVTVAGNPLDAQRTYSVAIKDYLRSGKDGYDMFPHCPVLVDAEALPALQAMVANYFSALETLTKHATDIAQGTTQPLTSPPCSLARRLSRRSQDLESEIKDKVVKRQSQELTRRSQELSPIKAKVANLDPLPTFTLHSQLFQHHDIAPKREGRIVMFGGTVVIEPLE